MSLLLLHASMVSMDGRQILINTFCSCNFIAWIHFREFGKYNFDNLVPLLKQHAKFQLHRGTGLFVVHLFALMLCANICHFVIYAFSFSV